MLAQNVWKCSKLQFPSSVQRDGCKGSSHGRDQLIFAILVTGMLCCFLPFPTFTLVFPLHSPFYRLRPAHCFSTSWNGGENDLASISMCKSMFLCVCVCAHTGLSISLLPALSLMDIVPSFGDCCVLSAHANTHRPTARCCCTANWGFSACCMRERLRVLVACQFGIGACATVCVCVGGAYTVYL